MLSRFSFIVALVLLAGLAAGQQGQKPGLATEASKVVGAVANAAAGAAKAGPTALASAVANAAGAAAAAMAKLGEGISGTKKDYKIGNVVIKLAELPDSGVVPGKALPKPTGASAVGAAFDAAVKGFAGAFAKETIGKLGLGDEFLKGAAGAVRVAAAGVTPPPTATSLSKLAESVGKHIGEAAAKIGAKLGAAPDKCKASSKYADNQDNCMQDFLTRMSGLASNIMAEKGLLSGFPEPSNIAANPSSPNAAAPLKVSLLQRSAKMSEMILAKRREFAKKHMSALEGPLDGIAALVTKCATDKRATPELLIIGASGNIGPGVGGAELVYDFKKRQIAPFAYGGATVGTSSINIGAGGYLGVGWKGKTKDDNIIPAYKAWFNGAYGGATVLGVDISGVISVSSNQNKPNLPAYTPDCAAVVTLTGGAGVSLLPIKISAGVTSTYYASDDKLMIDCSQSWWGARKCMLGQLFLQLGCPGNSLCPTVMALGTALAAAN